MKKVQHRLFLLDIFRIICALLIFARHSITMYGCTYGYRFDDYILQMTSPVMTCFFIMSGFSVHYQHRTDEISAEWTRRFMLKRMISIMPSYMLVVFAWPLVFPRQTADWLYLLPIDIIGIQTSYRTLFGILHNGGTWFVSCLLLGYVLYPVIKSVLSSKKRIIPVISVVLPHFLLLYSIIIIQRFSLDSLYSNPIARAAEFMIGVSFAELIFDNDQKELTPVWAVLCLSAVSVIIAAVKHVSAKVMVFTYLPTPVILVALFLACRLRSRYLENSKTLSVMSGITYQFFLMQLFLWKLSAWVLEFFHVYGNKTKIFSSLCLCTLISWFIRQYYDKPIKKLLIHHFVKEQ